MKVPLYQLVTLLAIFGIKNILSEELQPINTVPEDPWNEHPKSIKTPPKNPPNQEAKPNIVPLKKLSAPQTYPPPETYQHRAQPSLRDQQFGGTMGGFNRMFEFRGGTRVSALFGKIRPGRDGSSELDFRDDLRLKGVDVGPQLDFEMQISEKTHVLLSYGQSGFSSGTITTSRPLQYQGIFAGQQNPSTLPAGSAINTSLDTDLFSGHFRYDIIKTNSITFAPLVGFKAAFIEENVTINSATPGIATVRDNTIVNEVTPIVGFDARYQFNRHFYFGIVPVGFVLDKYSYVGGQGFLHYDFNKDFGLRLGLDIDYVSTLRDKDSHFSTSTTLGTAFLQGVYGF